MLIFGQGALFRCFQLKASIDGNLLFLFLYSCETGETNELNPTFYINLPAVIDDTVDLLVSLTQFRAKAHPLRAV